MKVLLPPKKGWKKYFCSLANLTRTQSIAGEGAQSDSAGEAGARRGGGGSMTFLLDSGAKLAHEPPALEDFEHARHATSSSKQKGSASPKVLRHPPLGPASGYLQAGNGLEVYNTVGGETSPPGRKPLKEQQNPEEIFMNEFAVRPCLAHTHPCAFAPRYLPARGTEGKRVNKKRQFKKRTFGDSLNTRLTVRAPTSNLRRNHSFHAPPTNFNDDAGDAQDGRPRF